MFGKRSPNKGSAGGRDGDRSGGDVSSRIEAIKRSASTPREEERPAEPAPPAGGAAEPEAEGEAVFGRAGRARSPEPPRSPAAPADAEEAEAEASFGRAGRGKPSEPPRERGPDPEPRRSEPRRTETANPAPPRQAAGGRKGEGAAKPPPRAGARQPKPVDEKVVHVGGERSAEYYKVKTAIFNALIDTIDLSQLTKLDAETAAEEIRDIVTEIISIKNVAMSIAEQEQLLQDIVNDILGYGPLEPLLARDDIADIMVNGAENVFIEVGGKVRRTNVKFRDNAQLMNICQRIVSQVGRRVDESSPICDARLLDGSRVNVIAPPLALDGPTLTIRKFKKDKLTMRNLVEFGSITPEGARVLEIIGTARCNVVISGGTGSGKTTLLNCLTGFISEDERIITCEDAAELQLQQPHVVRLETRPPNLEGQGQVTMRDLVKNCLRMRPERIIVGEVRGPEAFDLLQAMNTGHDGSMGTLHANSPREALSRIESMITMGGFSLPAKTIREMISGSVDVIVQAARLRDGSRKITHITEVLGMEGEVIITQDLFVFDIQGEDSAGNIVGRHMSTGIARPAFWDRARYYGLERDLAEALDAAEA